MPPHDVIRLTCRQQCDQERPSCSQCIRHGVVCDGYDRRVKFVNGYPEKKRTAVVSVSPLEKLHRADPCALAVGRTILNKAAYECQYVDVFWEAYLPYSRAASPLAAQYSTTGWTAIAQRLYPDHELLKLALGAFSFCAVGRKSDDEWMMVKGRSLYGMALQEMARALRSSEKNGANDDVIIIASKILNLFEVFFETNHDDKLAQYKIWFSHSAGEEALFLRRGPAAYATGDAHYLLEDGRLQMAILDMMNRKRSFLSSPEWKTIPWQGIDKTPKDTLLDIFVDIPEVLEGLDALYGLDDNPPKRDHLRHSFLERVTGYERELQNWYEQTSRTDPWICVDTSHPRNEVGLAGAHLMALYWSARLALFNTRRLPIFPTNKAQNMADAEVFKERIMPLIARLTEEKSGWFGRQAAVFPGGAANCMFVSLYDEGQRDLEVDKLTELFGAMESTAISPTFLGCQNSGTGRAKPISAGR
ncbi:hypothetical protein CC79DRAFT_1335467 [Sarocladium strictum]